MEPLLLMRAVGALQEGKIVPVKITLKLLRNAMVGESVGVCGWVDVYGCLGVGERVCDWVCVCVCCVCGCVWPCVCWVRAFGAGDSVSACSGVCYWLCV